MFLSNTAFMLLSLVALACAGWFVVAPFAPTMRWPVLVAPFCGLIILPIFTLAGYVYLRLPFASAAWVAFVVCAGASLLRGLTDWPFGTPFRPRLSKEAAYLLLILCAVAVLSMLALNALSLRDNTLTFVFRDFTDQAGYAQLADWLVSQPVEARPAIEPQNIWQSWPAEMRSSDPRFGSFALLALVSLVRQTSGLFAFDSACALVWCCALLAFAGVFTRRWLSLVLLMTGLATCYWLDFGHSGFFGKMVGFPASILVLSFALDVLRAQAMPRYDALASVMLLTLCVGVIYPGLLSVMLLLFCGGSFVLFQAAQQKIARADILQTLLQNFMLLGVLSFAALAVSGTLARPIQVGWPDFHAAWPHIVPRLFDLEHQTIRLSHLPGSLIKLGTVLSFGFCGLIIIAASYQRNAKAFALVFGSLALIIILFAANQKTAAFQLLGFAWPLSVLAAVSLLEQDGAISLSPQFMRRFAIFACVIVAFHIPRMVGILARYDMAQDAPSAVYREDEMAALTAKTAGQSVYIDGFDNPQQALIVLVTLSRTANLTWAQSGWDFVVGYRHWPLPENKEPASLHLVSVDTTLPATLEVVMRTQNYVLLKNTP